MTWTIDADRAVVGRLLVDHVTVTVDGERIVAVEPRHAGHRRASVATLTAGLVDLQVNGLGPIDLVRAGPEDFVALGRELARHGVSAYCPTAITAPLGELVGFAARVGRQRSRPTAGAAEILGAHLEGPFLSMARRGAHPPAWLTEPTAESVARLVDPVRRDDLAIVTIAPELPGALEAIGALRRAGVVAAIGHSDATAGQVAEAADAGATMVTHLFNAQRPLHHRDPGVVGRALVDSRLTLGLIADLHHVAADALRLAFAAAPGRIALVSDTVCTGQPSRADPAGVPPRLTDGTLAGAVATLDRAVGNLIGLGLDPVAVVNAASATPASALGRTDLGRLGAGARAHLVAWTDDWRVDRVWLAGQPIDGADRPAE